MFGGMTPGEYRGYGQSHLWAQIPNFRKKVVVKAGSYRIR
jgi:hypothetical protein